MYKTVKIRWDCNVMGHNSFWSLLTTLIYLVEIRITDCKENKEVYFDMLSLGWTNKLNLKTNSIRKHQ
jgi:hypothetical protein